jgi:hypothetical protein
MSDKFEHDLQLLNYQSKLNIPADKDQALYALSY